MRRKKPVLIAWIHSHVTTIKCNFSSVDLHTQNTLSKLYDGILGMVVEINEDGKVAAFDFYELSKKGKRWIENCSKSPECNSRMQHEYCSDSSLYQSARKNVQLESTFHLKVKNFISPTNNANMKIQNSFSIDDDDFQTADVSMDLENWASQRLRKRKKSKSFFEQSPSKSAKQKRNNSKRINCPFCGKNVAESYLVYHIEKTIDCKDKCGDNKLQKLKNEKIQRKRDYNKVRYCNNAEKRKEQVRSYASQNREKVIKRKDVYNNAHRVKIRERQVQYSYVFNISAG